MDVTPLIAALSEDGEVASEAQNRLSRVSQKRPQERQQVIDRLPALIGNARVRAYRALHQLQSQETDLREIIRADMTNGNSAPDLLGAAVFAARSQLVERC